MVENPPPTRVGREPAPDASFNHILSRPGPYPHKADSAVMAAYLEASAAEEDLRPHSAPVASRREGLRRRPHSRCGASPHTVWWTTASLILAARSRHGSVSLRGTSLVITNAVITDDTARPPSVLARRAGGPASPLGSGVLRRCPTAGQCRLGPVSECCRLLGCLLCLGVWLLGPLSAAEETEAAPPAAPSLPQQAPSRP